MRKKPKLTIGMATAEDHRGVKFTIQALRMYHPICRTDDVEILVVDNRPESKHGKANQSWLGDRWGNGWVENGKWIPFPWIAGTTAPRDHIFEVAEADVVIVIDAHVFLVPGFLEWVIDYFEKNPESKDMLQGPNLYDDLNDFNVNSHMEPVWRERMFGVWGNDLRARNPDFPPFEIQMHGLGFYAMRKAAWPQVSDRFRGFGGEEGNFHRLVRRSGGKVLCCPALQWWHDYQDCDNFPKEYNGNTNFNRVRNYLLWWKFFGEDAKELVTICEHFAGILTPDPEVEMLRMEFGYLPELDWLRNDLKKEGAEENGLVSIAEGLLSDGDKGTPEDGQQGGVLLSRAELPGGAERTDNSEQPPETAGVGWESIGSGSQRAGVFDAGSLPE